MVGTTASRGVVISGVSSTSVGATVGGTSASTGVLTGSAIAFCRSISKESGCLSGSIISGTVDSVCGFPAQKAPADSAK